MSGRNDPRTWGYDDYHAIFFGWEKSEPTFHGFAFGKRDEEEGVSRDYSRCGLIVGEFVDGRLRDPGTWMPLRHAVKFGKPCAKCFRRAAVGGGTPK